MRWNLERGVAHLTRENDALQLKIKDSFTIEASRVVTYGFNRDGLRLVEKAFEPPLLTIGLGPHCVSLRSTTILNTL